MTVDLEDQVRGYSEHFVGLSDPITIDEVESSGAIGFVREIKPRTSSYLPRSRRWAWVVGAAAAVLLLVGVPALVRPDGGAGSGSGLLPDLGVFESLRGRIVVVNGSQLEAIDPTDPTSPVVLDIPAVPPVPDEACSGWSSGPCDDGADSLMPVGWSSDGTVLALESEHAGMTYLMDAAGSISRVRRERVTRGHGCCWFVTSNWLSPDGHTAVMGSALFDLTVVDLADMSVESDIDLELDDQRFPRLEGWGRIYAPTWSPDGTEFAYIVASFVDGAWSHTIHIYNRDLKTRRQLAHRSFGHIRNLAWSPNEERLLVIAGDRVLTDSLDWNPLAEPQATSLYLVDVDSGESHVIADGHFVAAAWSPDGGRLAAVDYLGGHHLVVMDADGTNQQNILDMSGYPFRGVWTGVTWHPSP